MLNKFYKLIQNHKILFIVILILIVVPFFWLKPGEIDLGGDSSRLYFYDPLAYSLTSLLYVISPTAIGYIDSGVFSPLPQIALLIGLKSFFSSYFIITIFNILKLVFGFLGVYLIVKELINQKDNDAIKLVEFSAMFAGLFYILSRHLVSNYDKALLYHNQVFLNPLMIYLVLKYLLTKNAKYGWVALLITFIFASNFSYLASPPFFAFYPLVFAFIFLYTLFVRRVHLPWKGIVVGGFLFVGLHAFHIVPVLFDAFSKGSHTNTRLFDSASISDQFSHFFGILQLSSISKTLFLPSWNENLIFLSVIFPLIIIFGFFFNKYRSKTMILTGIFFLITFFLLTAKILQIGIDFYSRLFYIPGFSLFRNFTGIWTYVYSFFYALLIGQALFAILSKLSYKTTRYVFGAGLFLLVVSAWSFINGVMVNPVHYQSKDVKTAIIMDPEYEETLRYIKSIPNDSKFLNLPFTDCCMQVLFGTNNGAYMGPSTLGYLAGKSDFTGYGISAPFSELFFQLAKEKDYVSFKRMLGILNVQYIFHNSDDRILNNFPIYPFSPDYVRKFFPTNQKDYFKFVENLADKKIFEKSFYNISLLDEKYFLPHFYVPKSITVYENDPKLNQTYARASSFESFLDDNLEDPRIIFVEKQDCIKASLTKLCNASSTLEHVPNIYFERVNRTKYRIRITDSSGPFIIVFSEVFSNNWKLFEGSGNSLYSKNEENIAYFNNEIIEGKHENIFLDSKTFETWGKKEIAKNNHFEVNGYANAWLIHPEEMKGRDYELILELTTQITFYIIFPISLIFLLFFLTYGIMLLLRRKKH